MAYLHAQQTDSASQAPIKEFRYLYVVLFCVFLLLAMTGQMLFMDWRNWLPGAEGSRPMLGSVKSAVYTVISQLN
jgi:light-harvesting complex 1 beta chain